MNETINLIKNHRSIRTYLEKDISDDILDEILKAVHSMSTSINGQQVSVIVVRDKEKKSELAKIAGGQTWIEKAPVFLVFVADFYKTYLAGNKAGNSQIIHESIEGTVVGTFDSGLAMGAAIISAESLGLGLVPLGGIRRDPEEVIKLLKLPKYTYPIAGLCIGYPADESRKKPRLPFETFVHRDEYSVESLQGHIEKYDEKFETYLTEIGREKEVNWSTNTSGIYKSVYFPKVHPTMKKQGFTNDK